jgi:hypothetical protein
LSPPAVRAYTWAHCRCVGLRWAGIQLPPGIVVHCPQLDKGIFLQATLISMVKAFVATHVFGHFRGIDSWVTKAPLSRRLIVLLDGLEIVGLAHHLRVPHPTAPGSPKVRYLELYARHRSDKYRGFGGFLLRAVMKQCEGESDSGSVEALVSSDNAHSFRCIGDVAPLYRRKVIRHAAESVPGEIERAEEDGSEVKRSPYIPISVVKHGCEFRACGCPENTHV